MNKKGKRPKTVFIIEIFLFSLILVLGVLTADRADRMLRAEEVRVPKVSFWEFIAQFLIATLFILFLTRIVKAKKKKGLVFKIIFGLATFWGGVLMLSVWIPDPLALLLMISLVVLWWKKPSVLIQDLCMILALSGSGSILGLTFSPQTVVLFLIILSLYDFVAVYKTKHMVEMAKDMIESRAILGLVIPPSLAGFWGSLEKVEPGGRFIVLGGGDIVFPLLLCSSLVPVGISRSFFVAFFALLGFVGSLFLFHSAKKRKPIPALPPIALFSVIGYLLTLTF